MSKSVKKGGRNRYRSAVSEQVMTYQDAYSKLEKYGQLHVLKYYDELNEEQKAQLLQQVEDTDFSVLQFVDHKDPALGTGKISPIAAMELDEIERRKDEFTPISESRTRSISCRDSWKT